MRSEQICNTIGTLIIFIFIYYNVLDNYQTCFGYGLDPDPGRSENEELYGSQSTVLTYTVRIRTHSSASECVPQEPMGGHTRLQMRGWESLFGRLESGEIA
jgi:hypothetical protein